VTPDDLTPERLDAILSGSEPATSHAERDMLALAASLRNAAPHAGDDLRDRVRAIAAPAPTGREARRLGPGWRTRLLIAAPALATVTAAVVVIAVVGGDDPVKNQTSLTSAESAGASTTTAASTAARSSADAVSGAPSLSAAPEAKAGPVTVLVEPGTLQQRIADARRIVATAGGTVNVTRQATAEPGSLLTITLAPDREAVTLAKLVRLGDVRDGAAAGADGTVRLLLKERTAP
jgi:hypothetical protein